MPHAAVRALLRATHPAAATDADLLARFAAGRDEAAFSPDGARVTTGHANGTALVWPLGP